MKKLNAKEKIINHIRQNGHRVVKLTGANNLFYDFMVDGKTRVCVIGFTTQKLSDCDVIAAAGQKKRYRFNQEPIEWQTITKIFGPRIKRSKKNKIK